MAFVEQQKKVLPSFFNKTNVALKTFAKWVSSKLTDVEGPTAENLIGYFSVRFTDLCLVKLKLGWS